MQQTLRFPINQIFAMLPMVKFAVQNQELDSAPSPQITRRNRALLLLLLLSRISRVQLCAIPQTAARQAPRPWDSPGKNTGVGCHFLLQCMRVKSESEVTQSCLALSDPMDCSPPGSSVHGIFQARVGCHCLLQEQSTEMFYLDDSFWGKLH